MADLMTTSRILATECRQCGGVIAPLGRSMGALIWSHDSPADHKGVPDMPDLADPVDVERWLETPELVFRPPF